VGAIVGLMEPAGKGPASSPRSSPSTLGSRRGHAGKLRGELVAGADLFLAGSNREFYERTRRMTISARKPLPQGASFIQGLVGLLKERAAFKRTCESRSTRMRELAERDTKGGGFQKGKARPRFFFRRRPFGLDGGGGGAPSKTYERPSLIPGNPGGRT